MPTTSAIIAAYNEAASIGAVVDRCQRHVNEVVVVDDGSHDSTASNARFCGARVVRLENNEGKGAALRRAAAEAKGDRLITLDGDGQDDPSDIPRLLAAMDKGAQLVIGSRFLGTLHEGAITRVHRAGNRALTATLNRLYGVRLTDTQAGFRAIERSLWMKLPLSARRYEIETEVLVQALLAGAVVTEVPVSRRPRAHGSSTLGTIRDGSRILACMVRAKVRSRDG